MRRARAVLDELLTHVQPPRGCAIVLTEWKSDVPPEPNWVAASGIMSTQALTRFAEKVADLRKSDSQVDWSDERTLDGLRRVALWLSEVDGS